MYSVAKVIDASPASPKFLSTLIFVFDEKSKMLANIMVLMEEKELFGVVMNACVRGPKVFSDVLTHIKEHFADYYQDMQRLIWKERIPDLWQTETFIAEHFFANLPKYTAMAIDEDVAGNLRQCMPRRPKSKLT